MAGSGQLISARCRSFDRYWCCAAGRILARQQRPHHHRNYGGRPAREYSGLGWLRWLAISARPIRRLQASEHVGVSVIEFALELLPIGRVLRRKARAVRVLLVPFE